MADKQAVIKEILEIELEMFLTVRTQQRSSCQDYPESFKLHRRVQFTAWSEETAKSYLKDLKNAVQEGVNLMTVKYARMDDLIPGENKNPLIKEIVKIQYGWQEEMFRRYPYLMGGARPLSKSEDNARKTSFETYLSGELETYSDTTLELLFKDMSKKIKDGVNMSGEVYGYLVREMGYPS
ncbi:MAG TPA: DUF4125 family protein, partial [Spirochaetes bacterium]|nr:DUF4125 family protein [Spirochaetota bacterium]